MGKKQRQGMAETEPETKAGIPTRVYTTVAAHDKGLAQDLARRVHGTGPQQDCGLNFQKETAVKEKVYLSGAITDVDGYEEIFAEAALEIREVWLFDCISPAEKDEEIGKDKPWGHYLAADLTIILTDPDLTGIVMLPGWEKSKGCRLEKHAAEARGLRVIYYGESEDRGPITRAVPLVHGDRQKKYGHPIEDFTRTAGIWKAMFGWSVKPRDVPLAMIAVKLSRLRKTPDHMDSETDIAGYIETYAMCREREDAPRD